MSTGQGWFAAPYWSSAIGPVNLKMKRLLLLKNSFGFLLRDFGLLPAILAGALWFIPSWFDWPSIGQSHPMYRAPGSGTLGIFERFGGFGQLVALLAADHGYFALHDR